MAMQVSLLIHTFLCQECMMTTHSDLFPCKGPNTTSPAMSPASSHMFPVHCMSPGTSSHMSPVSMSPAGHMSANNRQGSPQPNMAGMSPPPYLLARLCKCREGEGLRTKTNDARANGTNDEPSSQTNDDDAKNICTK